MQYSRHIITEVAHRSQYSLLTLSALCSCDSEQTVTFILQPLPKSHTDKHLETTKHLDLIEDL